MWNRASFLTSLRGSEPGSSRAWARPMRLTGALMTLCALVACGEGRQASLATPVLSYNGSHPFSAVIGESMALTPAVSGTIGHCTASPPLPPGLSLDGQSGGISGTPTQASGSATYMVNASGAGVRASFPLVLSATEPPSHLSYPSPAKGRQYQSPNARPFAHASPGRLRILKPSSNLPRTFLQPSCSAKRHIRSSRGLNSSIQ
jgi:hypothetical protein